MHQVGWVAQSVEQRTENPCVGGSIPSPATTLINRSKIKGFLVFSAFQSRLILASNKSSLCHFCSTFPVLAGHDSEIICLVNGPAGRGTGWKAGDCARLRRCFVNFGGHW